MALLASSRSAQRGATFFGVLSVAIVAGIFLTVAFKLFQPYWDHRTITAVLQSVSENPDDMRLAPSQIRSNIDRRFTINQVSLPSRDALTVTEEAGVVKLELNYEIRVPMFGNVDAVISFEETFEGRKP